MPIPDNPALPLPEKRSLKPVLDPPAVFANVGAPISTEDMP
jgi:hypothetical protein